MERKAGKKGKKKTKRGKPPGFWLAPVHHNLPPRCMECKRVEVVCGFETPTICCDCWLLGAEVLLSTLPVKIEDWLLIVEYAGSYEQYLFNKGL